MATKAVIADNQKMFTEGVQLILKDLMLPDIKIVGIANNLNELSEITNQFPVDLLILELAIADELDTSIIVDYKKAFPNMKIIILSNYGDYALVRDAFKKGVDGYVLKSNHAIELAQCIDFVMEGKTYMAEGIRLAPEYNSKKKKANESNRIKACEDRLLLKQKLTKRELEVLSLIVQYKNNKMIAQELFISDQTVSAHRKRIMKKFGINNTVKLIKFSLDHQLV